MRLACQVQVKRDMKIEVPPEMLDIRKWECTVVSNENIATFIKELVIQLAGTEDKRKSAAKRRGRRGVKPRATSGK